jgi:uncharacterized protein
MNTAASRSVDAFIEALPQPQRAVAERLRELLFETVPDIEERFSFKLPFYHYYGTFCYLHVDKTGLHLCFCRSKDLVDAFPQLEQKARATIASVTVHTTADILRLEIPQLIAAAAEWNKEAAVQKIPMVQRKTQSRKKQ